MSRNVHVTHGVQNGWTEVRTPYHEDFVDDIKSEIPHRQRSWNPETEAWRVAPEYADYVTKLTTHYFGETIVIDEDGSEEYIGPGGTVARQDRLL